MGLAAEVGKPLLTGPGQGQGGGQRGEESFYDMVLSLSVKAPLGVKQSYHWG